MSDYGDMCRDLKDARGRVRKKYGEPCAGCLEFLPLASPTILLPGQSCTKRGHRYKDPRPHNPEANIFIEAGFERVQNPKQQKPPWQERRGNYGDLREDLKKVKRGTYSSDGYKEPQ